MNNPKYIIVHHTGGSDANPLQDSSNYTFAQCDKDHKVRFNFVSSLGYYVGYHYYIEKDGTLHQARADGDEGAHTIGKNSSSLGVCMAGNFDFGMPTPAQVITLKELLIKKTSQYNIPAVNIVPHRTFANKTCYGNNLADDWAAKLISTPSNDSTKPRFKFSMAMGWSYTPSDSVKALQSILKYEKVLPADFSIDGKFLEQTARGLKTWQISHGILDFQLEPDPQKIRAGLKTIIKLNELYS